jgi:hypothetical protein
MRIVTNNQPRPICGWEFLTVGEQDDFDWIHESSTLTTDDADFVRYRGSVYCLNDMMASQLQDWDDIHHESAFSAVLVRYCDDPFYVIMGRALA